MATMWREEWEEPGYRVADHTNSPPVDAGRLEYVVNHYPAAETIWTPDPVEWFRSVQRSYVNGRGYSIGYSWGYWPDGLEVELRGWDYRNAANDAGDDENAVSVALLFVVPGLGDGGDPATPAQLAAAQTRMQDVYDRAGRTLPNIVHGDLEGTGCAGAGVNHQTHTGQMIPNRPTPPPIIDDPEDETDMILIVVGNYPDDNYAAFAQTPAGVLRWIVTGWELTAWLADSEVAEIPPDAFAATVDAGRTLGNISDEVVRITGVTRERWAGRAIA